MSKKVKQQKNILTANSFLYPTEKERRDINMRAPKIKRLKIEYESAIMNILNITNPDIENAIRKEDIYWWNNCLDNRIGKLVETYTYVIAHFSRIPKIPESSENIYNTDAFLLDYFIEIFYYYYFSTRDILAQLLNVSFNLKIAEDRISLNEKFTKRIKPLNENIQIIIDKFIANTKKSSYYRNSFTHRFTPTHLDNRAVKNIIKKDKSIELYHSKKIDKNDFIFNIKESMKEFSDLMNSISLSISK